MSPRPVLLVRLGPTVLELTSHQASVPLTLPMTDSSMASNDEARKLSAGSFDTIDCPHKEPVGWTPAPTPCPKHSCRPSACSSAPPKAPTYSSAHTPRLSPAHHLPGCFQLSSPRVLQALSFQGPSSSGSRPQDPSSWAVSCTLGPGALPLSVRFLPPGCVPALCT